jgi:hypothetical protein
LLLAVFLAPAGRAEVRLTNIYSTRFEAAEGYNASLDLAGQQGWLGTDGPVDNADNGLLSGFFAGEGQHAYIGFSPLATDASSYAVWQPINLSPLPADFRRVRFTALMGVVDSHNGYYDCFRWSVYNAAGTRLFTLDFDNSDFTINYRLQNDPGFTPTGFTFSPDFSYALEIVMNFASNLWSATLGGVAVVTDLPLAAAGTPRDLGDVDAVWVVRVPGLPGDNFMVFDNYSLSAELPPLGVPPSLTVLGRQPGGAFDLRVTGEAGCRYAVEASTNLLAWSALTTNTAAGDGTVTFSDPEAAMLRHRFYRARLVP